MNPCATFGVSHASECRDTVGIGWPDPSLYHICFFLSAFDGKCLVNLMAVATWHFRGGDPVTCSQHLDISDEFLWHHGQRVAKYLLTPFFISNLWKLPGDISCHVYPAFERWEVQLCHLDIYAGWMNPCYKFGVCEVCQCMQRHHGLRVARCLLPPFFLCEFLVPTFWWPYLLCLF